MKIPEELTCIECPWLYLRLKETDGKIEVSGNQCRRGEEYGRKALHPAAALPPPWLPGMRTARACLVHRRRDPELLFAALRRSKTVREPVLTGQVLIRISRHQGDVIATVSLMSKIR